MANEGLYRFSGIYGSAWLGGTLLSDAIEVSGSIEINRIEVPLVGSQRTGYKPGRESREGTLRIQKFDSAWEMKVYRFLRERLERTRQERTASNTRGIEPFDLIVKHQDPDALGDEEWVLEGCVIWRLTLGFSIGEDLTEREYPLTWENERPLRAFKKVSDSTAAPAALAYDLSDSDKW